MSKTFLELRQRLTLGSVSLVAHLNNPSVRILQLGSVQLRLHFVLSRSLLRLLGHRRQRGQLGTLERQRYSPGSGFREPFR